MNLPQSVVGAGEPSLTFVHGFTQTRASWEPVVEVLSGRHRCVVVDAPHHGEAQSIDVDFDTASDLVAQSAAGSVLVGYSMGGRLAIASALRHPREIRGLVLVSTTAGLDTDADRAARRDADETLAEHIERIGTREFLTEWTAQPLFAHSTLREGDLASRLTNEPGSLATSLRRCGSGVQPSLWGQLSTITVPVLIVAGVRDDKYVRIAERLHDEIAESELRIIGDAGHATHLDQPTQFAELVEEFVARRITT